MVGSDGAGGDRCETAAAAAPPRPAAAALAPLVRGLSRLGGTSAAGPVAGAPRRGAGDTGATEANCPEALGLRRSASDATSEADAASQARTAAIAWRMV